MNVIICLLKTFNLVWLVPRGELMGYRLGRRLYICLFVKPWYMLLQRVWQWKSSIIWDIAFICTLGNGHTTVRSFVYMYVRQSVPPSLPPTARHVYCSVFNSRMARCVAWAGIYTRRLTSPPGRSEEWGPLYFNIESFAVVNARIITLIHIHHSEEKHSK